VRNLTNYFTVKFIQILKLIMYDGTNNNNYFHFNNILITQE